MEKDRCASITEGAGSTTLLGTRLLACMMRKDNAMCMAVITASRSVCRVWLPAILRQYCERLEMGVVKETLRPGKGPKPKMGDRVTMHYVCRLAQTGKIVDSSKIKGRAAEFQIGTGRVIQGWDEGVMEMENGEEAILKVTSDFAYGTSGRPPTIPPNADLDFTCELLAINESMVAASMRVKSEQIALEQEDEIVRQAQAEAIREAAEAEGPALPGGGEGDACPAEKKRKRKKGEKKRKKSSKRRASSSDSSSISSSVSSSSTDSSRPRKKSSKKKHRHREKAGGKSSKKKKDKKRRH